MSDVEEATDRQEFASRIVARTKPEERVVLRRWIEEMLSIRDSNSTPLKKVARALTASVKSTAMITLIKLMAVEAKRVGWDDRKRPTRFGLIGGLVGLATLGTEGAGIAALGTAIGIPLWVIFGAGGLALGAILEEMGPSSVEKPPSSEVEVVPPIHIIEGEAQVVEPHRLIAGPSKEP